MYCLLGAALARGVVMAEVPPPSSSASSPQTNLTPSAQAPPPSVKVEDDRGDFGPPDDAPRANAAPSTKILVSDINPRLSEKDISDDLAQYGAVLTVTVPMSLRTGALLLLLFLFLFSSFKGMGAGYALVEMADLEGAKKVVNNCTTIKGDACVVEYVLFPSHFLHNLPPPLVFLFFREVGILEDLFPCVCHVSLSLLSSAASPSSHVFLFLSLT